MFDAKSLLEMMVQGAAPSASQSRSGGGGLGDLLGQLLGDGHELASHHMLALKLDLASQPDRQERLEDEIGRNAFPDQIDGYLLPLI